MWRKKNRHVPTKMRRTQDKIQRVEGLQADGQLVPR